jgi:hypothetical protein
MAQIKMKYASGGRNIDFENQRNYVFLKIKHNRLFSSKNYNAWLKSGDEREASRAAILESGAGRGATNAEPARRSRS